MRLTGTHCGAEPLKLALCVSEHDPRTLCGHNLGFRQALQLRIVFEVREQFFVCVVERMIGGSALLFSALQIRLRGLWADASRWVVAVECKCV